MSELFEILRAERERGEHYTVADWFAEHPPPEEAFSQTLAGIAERVGAGERFEVAVREFLDEFKLRPSDASRQRAIDDPPAPTPDVRHDAYLGALAEHLALTGGLDRPDWCCEPGRFLDRFWFPSRIPGFRALALAQSPSAFRRRGIFIAAASLERL